MDPISKLAQLADIFAATGKTKQYVYHLKSPKFKGKYIYPLSELKEIDPGLHEESLDKYKDRLDWIDRKIPHLACKATDVVNLSAINPAKLFAVEILLDIEPIEDKVIFKIPISSLKKQEMVFFSYDKSLKYKYKKQDPKKYKECLNVPLDTVEHYMDSKREKESPLIFEYVPHILVKGKVDISNAELIKFKTSDIKKLF